MQGRSWMAALTLIAGFLLTSVRLTFGAEDPVVVGKVQLVLAIAGLRGAGCDVEVKPGHAGCRFKPVIQHVGPGGKAEIVLKDVESRNADRDCAFAITIKEPGHADRTVHRGLRLNASAGRERIANSLTCYISSSSKLAEREARRLRR